jgi:hypothetical protein
MHTGFDRGMAVVTCLLFAGCLLAGQAGVHDVKTAHTLIGPGPSPEGLGIMFDNDVGVSDIIWPSDYAGFGDRIFPRGRAANFGSLAQADIAVIFVIYDSAAGARVYGPETVDVASLDSGEVRTVTFPYWDAPTEERVYFDTMVTVLQGDEDTTNDLKAGRFNVAAGGEQRLTYNDGETGPQGCYSWTEPNYSIGVRFPGHRSVSKISVGLWSWTGDLRGPYPCTCKVRLGDGADGMPGTIVWERPLMLYCGADPNDYINYIVLDPPAVVTTDSFYVTWKPQEVACPYPGFDWDEPIQTGNDYSTMPNSETWDPFSVGPEDDANGDLIIDAYCDAAGHSGMAVEKNVVGRASFTIAPNPVSRTATVHYALPAAGLATLDVYDATGRAVLNRTIEGIGSGTEVLDLRELKAGVYMVKVKADGFSSTQKLVVER